MSEVKGKVVPTGTQVAAARDLLDHMTQHDLAKAAGVHYQTISLFESGAQVPYKSTLDKIVKALEDRGIIFTNSDKPGITLDRSKTIIPT